MNAATDPLRILAKLDPADARRLLIELDARRYLREFEREQVRRAALHLVSLDLPRATIRDRLQARGVSRRTAQRIVSEVLRQPDP